MSNEEIIREELEAVAEEAKQIYISSGKRVTGNWLKGLTVESGRNEGTLFSYRYLAGRGRTRNPNDGSPTLVQRLTQWIKDRGIKPREENMKISSLAYVMARKIHREGTKKSNHLQVFEEVLTPERIQTIIDRVTTFNVDSFVRNATIEFEKLSNNV